MTDSNDSPADKLVDGPAIDPATLPVRTGTGYPAPHDEPCRGRRRRTLGDRFGLTDFGVNLLTLPPGTWSSQRHWHTSEDEFVYIVAGEPLLVTERGRQRLAPGMVAGFKAGVADGHHLINDGKADVVLLEIGSRRPGDAVDYSDIDMKIEDRGTRKRRFMTKAGEPL
ncbi:MAG: cupin domain-containing protein [Azospirillaceae bacterium]